MTHPCYAVLEVVLTGQDEPAPADRVPFWAVFEHESGYVKRVPGFWDGGNRYLARFAPEHMGSWTWTTSSEAAGLSGRTALSA